VTRQRLYLDTMENVLSRANKVVVDSSASGNGNMLYLPLDKLLEQSRANADAAAQDAAKFTLQAEPESVTVEGRTRGER
jgi:membrane protease subunit HflK